HDRASPGRNPRATGNDPGEDLSNQYSGCVISRSNAWTFGRHSTLWLGRRRTNDFLWRSGSWLRGALVNRRSNSDHCVLHDDRGASVIDGAGAFCRITSIAAALGAELERIQEFDGLF